MANTWESLQMTITKNNSTKVAHYETDTANIVDFEEASNKLINAALTAFSKDTNLTGTTNIQYKVFSHHCQLRDVDASQLAEYLK